MQSEAVVTNEEFKKIRYNRLVQVCNKALGESIKKLQGWDKIQDCFAGYAQTNTGTENLRICQEQVIKLWTNLCKVEFEAIFHERSVEEKLNQLDELIEKSKSHHSSITTSDGPKVDELTPAQLLEGNIEGAKLKTLEKLDDRLRTISNKNNELENMLKELNNKVFDELDSIQQVFDELLNESLIVPDEAIKNAVNDMIFETRQFS